MSNVYHLYFRMGMVACIEALCNRLAFLHDLGFIELTLSHHECARFSSCLPDLERPKGNLSLIQL
jgi:hypothetical protein